MPYEYQRSFWLRTLRECAGKADKCRCARAVIICSVVYAVCGSAIEGTLCVPEMIVVGAESDERAFELRIAAFNKADHVACKLCIHDLVVRINIQRQADSFEGKCLQAFP